MDTNLIKLLENSKDRIKQLERENELMRVRLGMFDNMMLLITTPPNYPGYECSPSITSEIEKFLENEKKKIEGMSVSAKS